MASHLVTGRSTRKLGRGVRQAVAAEPLARGRWPRRRGLLQTSPQTLDERRDLIGVPVGGIGKLVD